MLAYHTRWRILRHVPFVEDIRHTTTTRGGYGWLNKYYRLTIYDVILILTSRTTFLCRPGTVITVSFCLDLSTGFEEEDGREQHCESINKFRSWVPYSHLILCICTIEAKLGCYRSLREYRNDNYGYRNRYGRRQTHHTVNIHESAIPDNDNWLFKIIKVSQWLFNHFAIAVSTLAHHKHSF